ncbi:MAG: isoprenylcysteine carboxylmethyltransferase family protein [Spirochaetaceae bacterium]|jgi:protein-S-isoprenylcysteine O-methyltransferase Ste14|nr:isoprenylcysteine carboxylmethyltransferase family protein [Spirochaetaceae bacterium]
MQNMEYINVIDVLVIISLAFFYVLLIGRTIMLYKKGIRVWVLGTSVKRLFERILEGILLPLLLILGGVFIVIMAFHIPLPEVISEHLIKFTWIKYAGILFCYLGLMLFLLALISFGKAWRIGIDEVNSNELITTGIFRFSRNPIYLFLDLYFMGIMLIYPNIVFAVIAGGTIIGVHLQIVREESFLLNKFGEKYSAYKKQTRRYI